MGIYRSYQIIDNDLILNEDLLWAFEPDQQEAVQVWTLLNFDKTSITIEELDHFVNYGGEDAELEIEEENGKTKISIFTYSDQSEYTIICERLLQSKRPYTTNELNQKILNLRKLLDTEDKVVYNKNQIIEEINKFIANEITKKERIIADKINRNSTAYIKAHGQLDTLKQLKTIIETFENKE